MNLDTCSSVSYPSRYKLRGAGMSNSEFLPHTLLTPILIYSRGVGGGSQEN